MTSGSAGVRRVGRGAMVALVLGGGLSGVVAGASGAAGPERAPDPAPTLVNPANPILFVTQVPVVGFTRLPEAFGTQSAAIDNAPRGGALMIRYHDGTLRNLTLEAGYGRSGSQNGAGNKAIAVRQPVVHWSGTRAMFSMAVGAPSQQYEIKTFRWQLYEVTGLQQGGTAVVTKVPCQPTSFNNLAPAYGSDDSVIFVSDRPRNGAAHLYPQRDEYESAPGDTGLWKIDPVACTVKIIEHAPSGVTYPSVDSYGRVLFTKWDHLLRDQQADADTFDGGSYGSFNFTSESSTTVPPSPTRDEYFPELRQAEYSLLPGAGYDGSSIAPDYPFSDMNINHFFPWMVNQDGSEEETLNHVGRQELGGSYSDPSYRDDPALDYIKYGRFSGAQNFLYGSGGMFHLREDPVVRGRVWGVRAPEFSTATAGDIVRIEGQPYANPDFMKVVLVGAKAQLGRMRNPLPTTDGRLLVVHTSQTGNEANTGTRANPVINYAFRIRAFNVATKTVGANLTAGIDTCASWWDPDVRVHWCGTLWELDPVEVVARPVPTLRRAPSLPDPEKQVLSTAGVSEGLLRNWLHSKGLALIVSRNVTTRDRSDDIQPYNLAVAGGGVQTIGLAGATVYDVSHLQIFQGDQLRGYFQNGTTTPQPGRRVLAVPLHHTAALSAMGSFPAGPEGSVPLSPDGSMAAFVPAGRALAWQLVDSSKSGWDQAVVRERNWISFKPGERRVCTSCHGLNTADQAGNATPTNAPQALAGLLEAWKGVVRKQCPATGGTGTWTYTGVAWSECDEGQRYQIQVCAGGNACCDGLPKTTTESCP